jgi:electron transfer flavoprotein beta subunit
VKLLVCVKRVGSLGDEIAFMTDGRGVDPDYLDHTLNEWDAAAIEEAVGIAERLGDVEVLLVTVGTAEDDEALRRGLAMGADRAIRIEAAPGIGDPVALAALLADVAREEQPDLILCGALSADTGHGATGAALGGHLDLPCAAVVSRLDWDGSRRSAVAHRELEGGVLAVTRIETPAVITVQTGINQPRYATLRAIKQAEAKEIRVVAGGVVRASAWVEAMFEPEFAGSAEQLGTDPAEVACRILKIISDAAA